MELPFLKIGAKISIISKANVRYEGVYVEMDTENLQIALSNVRFYGTESRAAEVFIAAQERIYPYVIFKSTDIKDMRVITNADEKPHASVQVNGYARDYPQSSLEFLRTFPQSRYDVTQNSLQTPKRGSPLQRKFTIPRNNWTRGSPSPSSRNTSRRGSVYAWRIPRVVDFIGRSGDPNELPMEGNGENYIFEQEYDFEKNNKLFEDLLNGVKELNSTFDSDVENEKEIYESKQSPPVEREQKVAETISNVSQGATPKKYDVIKSKPKLTPSAYNKNKSFFDTVSCSSIYRSPNSNPNWREWNKETFGVPMIRHQRRSRGSLLDSIKDTNENDGNKSEKNPDKIITDEKTNYDVQTEENVTVQKIRFQAVVVTKTRGYKSSTDGKANFEKNFKEDINEFDNDDVEKYSLKKYK